MAKKGAASGPRTGAQDGKKKATDMKSKKQSPGKKGAKPSAPTALEELAEKEEEEGDWEDESDQEMADVEKPVSKKAKNAKNARQAKKAAAKQQIEDDKSSDDNDSDGGGAGGFGFDLQRLDESDSDSEIEEPEAGDSEDDEDDEEDEIDVDDLSIGDSSDEEELAATTRVRETINNKEGLLAALRRIALDVSSPGVPFAFHQSVVSASATADAILSVEDDLVRELAFMNQSLEAARRARQLLRREGVPFARPADYFAETLRSDETMDKVKARLVEEATSKKASAEARKQRDLKKFGKQVQVAKQQERAKEKRETLDKINLLKKKRKDGASAALGATEADDLFDVAVDNELKSAGASHSGKKRSFSSGEHSGPNSKRQKKDTKYGFGGKKRHVKSGDATSSGDLSGFSARRMKSGGSSGRPGAGGGGGGAAGKKPFKSPRLGKSRRKVGKK